LPSGIDLLLGNDLCPGAAAVDVAWVTRSQTDVLRRKADLQTPIIIIIILFAQTCKCHFNNINSQ